MARNSGDLSELNSILKTYITEVDEATDKVLQEVADESLEILKAEAPERTGAYKDSLTVDRMGGAYVIHADAPGYRLTHLLEHGHDIVVNGEKVGRVKGSKHWKDAEKYAQDHLEERLREEIENI